jgi:hypothetical protein
MRGQAISMGRELGFRHTAGDHAPRDAILAVRHHKKNRGVKDFNVIVNGLVTMSRRGHAGHSAPRPRAEFALIAARLGRGRGNVIIFRAIFAETGVVAGNPGLP